MPTRFLFVTLFSGLALGPIVGPIVTDNRLALLDTMLGVWAVTLLIVAAVRERQLRPPVYPSALWPVALLVGGGVAYVFGGLWHTAACVLLVLGVLLWPAAVRPVASRVASAGRP